MYPVEQIVSTIPRVAVWRYAIDRTTPRWPLSAPLYDAFRRYSDELSMLCGPAQWTPMYGALHAARSEWLLR